MASFSKVVSYIVKLSFLYLLVAQVGCNRGNKFWTAGGHQVTLLITLVIIQSNLVPHNLHTGKANPCQYCHSGARKSANAGITPEHVYGLHFVKTDSERIVH